LFSFGGNVAKYDADGFIFSSKQVSKPIRVSMAQEEMLQWVHWTLVVDDELRRIRVFRFGQLVTGGTLGFNKPLAGTPTVVRRSMAIGNQNPSHTTSLRCTGFDERNNSRHVDPCASDECPSLESIGVTKRCDDCSLDCGEQCLASAPDLPSISNCGNESVYRVVCLTPFKGRMAGELIQFHTIHTNTDLKHFRLPLFLRFDRNYYRHPHLGPVSHMHRDGSREVLVDSGSGIPRLAVVVSIWQ
jgi:hypothetical protein